MSGLNFQINGEKFEATPENTVGFLHSMGRTAINGIEIDNDRFDHIFLIFEDSEKQQSGTNLFQERLDNFENIIEYMVENDYMVIMNKREVSEVDALCYLQLLENLSETEASNIDDELNKLLDGDEDGTPAR